MKGILQFTLHIVLAAALVVPCGTAKELLDRVAITVGLEVITEQEIYEQARIAAFLEGQEAEFTQQVLRETADRMVMQRLLLLDMRANGFPMPSEDELDAALESSRKEHWGSQEAFDSSAVAAGLDPMAIRLFLRSAVATVKYIDFRFRPAVRIAESVLLEKYMEEFPHSDEPGTPDPPEFEQVKEALEERLLEELVNQTIERWMEDARSQSGVRYLPEVLP